MKRYKYFFRLGCLLRRMIIGLGCGAFIFMSTHCGGGFGNDSSNASWFDKTIFSIEEQDSLQTRSRIHKAVGTDNR